MFLLIITEVIETECQIFFHLQSGTKKEAEDVFKDYFLEARKMHCVKTVFFGLSRKVKNIFAS